MDLLAELGFTFLPAAPAAGAEPPATDRPAGVAAGFAQLMRAPASDALVVPQATGTSSTDASASGRKTSSAAGNLTQLGQLASPTMLGPHASLEHQFLPSTAAASSETPAASSEKATAGDAKTPPPTENVETAVVASGIGAASPDTPAALETAKEQGDRAAPALPGEPRRDRKEPPGSPTAAPAVLVAAAPQPWEREVSEGELGEQTSNRRPVDAPMLDETGAAFPSDQDSAGSALAAVPPYRPQDPAAMDNACDAQAPAQSDSAGSKPLQQHAGPPVAHEVARTLEQAQSRDLATADTGADAGNGVDADDGADAPPLQTQAAQDAKSQVRSAEQSAPTQQSLGDPQSGRPLHAGGFHGVGGASPHPVGAAPTDSSLAITRGADGAGGPEAPPHAHHVSLHVTKVPDQDKTAIRIALDPPDLGEVDIDLEFRDLRLTATVRAERSDVLDLLQRDARTLARALRGAGVEIADSDISFHGGRADHGGQGAAAQHAIALRGAVVAAASLQALPARFEPMEGFVSLSDGRMDLRA